MSKQKSKVAEMSLGSFDFMCKRGHQESWILSPPAVSPCPNSSPTVRPQYYIYCIWKIFRIIDPNLWEKLYRHLCLFRQYCTLEQFSLETRGIHTLCDSRLLLSTNLTLLIWPLRSSFKISAVPPQHMGSLMFWCVNTCLMPTCLLIYFLLIAWWVVFKPLLAAWVGFFWEDIRVG